MRPFLHWPGGKNRIAKDLARLFPGKIKNYHEPFLGGGSMFFEIHERVKKAYLSDSNFQLIVTYREVERNVRLVIDELERHKKKNCKKHFYKVRDNRKGLAPWVWAAAFIYINKTGFNGLFRVNKKGQINVGWGKRKNPEIFDRENLISVSRALKGATIDRKMFWEIKPKPLDFVYCDPPYHGCFSGYTKEGFSEEDHNLLAHKVREWDRKNIKVMVSNSDTPFIRKIYKGFKIDKIDSFHQINQKVPENKKRVTELVIRNYKCSPHLRG